MSFMPYVAPEQLMKDRSEYAHKGIARGRSVIGLEFADGLLFIAENPSATLHKISEIYDRVAFAGVGKYSEFEELRIAGIRLADLRGYQYGREDVKARDLANAYSQALSLSFTHMANSSDVLRPAQKERVADVLEHDAQVISNTQLEELLAGERKAVQEEVLSINTDARHLALQIALIIPILAALLGLIQSFRMIRVPEPKPSGAAEGLVLG